MAELKEFRDAPAADDPLVAVGEENRRLREALQHERNIRFARSQSILLAAVDCLNDLAASDHPDAAHQLKSWFEALDRARAKYEANERAASRIKVATHLPTTPRRDD